MEDIQHLDTHPEPTCPLIWVFKVYIIFFFKVSTSLLFWVSTLFKLRFVSGSEDSAYNSTVWALFTQQKNNCVIQICNTNNVCSISADFLVFSHTSRHWNVKISHSRSHRNLDVVQSHIYGSLLATPNHCILANILQKPSCHTRTGLQYVQQSSS